MMNKDNTASFGLFGRTWRRALRMVGLVGVGLSVSASAVSAPPPSPIPQHWISYAQMTSNQFEAWLSDPANEHVVYLHAWMQEHLLKEGQPLPPPLVVRVWVAPNGHVSDVKFTSLGQAQADAAIRALLTTQPLSEPPPKDMMQPMVLQLSLQLNTKQ